MSEKSLSSLQRLASLTRRQTHCGEIVEERELQVPEEEEPEQKEVPGDPAGKGLCRKVL